MQHPVRQNSAVRPCASGCPRGPAVEVEGRVNGHNNSATNSAAAANKGRAPRNESSTERRRNFTPQLFLHTCVPAEERQAVAPSPLHVRGVAHPAPPPNGPLPSAVAPRRAADFYAAVTGVVFAAPQDGAQVSEAASGGKVVGDIIVCIGAGTGLQIEVKSVVVLVVHVSVHVEFRFELLFFPHTHRQT